MHEVTPDIYLVQQPSINWPEVERYLSDKGGLAWYERVYALCCAEDHYDEELGRVVGPLDDGEALVEFMGRLCYRSFDVGLNANVTKVREDSGEYAANVLSSLHGSVLEHANYSFVIANGSRVFTHELVRHRAGVAISQESMRYVRLDDLPIWQPEWALADEDLQREVQLWLWNTEQLQKWMTEHFGLDATKPCTKCEGMSSVFAATCTNCGGTQRVSSVPFSEKKAKTSYMRRWSPQGVATEMGWSANIRTLRWVIQQRTEEVAEEEIRLIFDAMAYKMKEQCPNFFFDFERSESGVWAPQYRKV